MVNPPGISIPARARMKSLAKPMELNKKYVHVHFDVYMMILLNYSLDWSSLDEHNSRFLFKY